MSLIGLLLGWTGLPKWATELIAVGVIAAGAVGAFWIYHHHVYVEGIHAQQVADQRASAKVVAEARAETKAAQAEADSAHAAYLQEMSHEALTAAHHPLPAVRLCLDSNSGGSGVPEGGAAHSRDAHPGTSTGPIRAVHGGSGRVRGGSGPNLAGLLGALARRADQVSAELREYQTRAKP